MPADRLFHPRLGHSERVNQLSHLEFRVWCMYELAADDFGVMRFSALTIQAACDAFEETPKADILAALNRIAQIGLVEVFQHQGRQYCCQLDWQNHQRVKYPRDTMQPMPPANLLARCTPMTQKLFAKHTTLRAEQSQPAADDAPTVGERSENDSPTIFQPSENDRETKPESPPKTLRLTANTNGERLMANEGVQGEPAPVFDGQVAFRRLVASYPQNRIATGQRVEAVFCDEMFKFSDPPAVTFARMLDNLENHKRSHEWRVKGMVPGLDKWLREGLWQRLLDENPPVAERVTAKTNKTLQGAADALRSAS